LSRSIRLILLRALSFLLLFAPVAAAQTPTVASIEIYGLRHVPEARVRKALGVNEGDSLPRSKGDVEERLTGVPGIVDAHLEATCCADNGVILYVGVEERGASHFDLRTPPEADLHLPQQVTDAYHEFLGAVNQAVRRGQTGEDLTYGHSLMADPDARDVQLKFVALADKYRKELHDVLHDSGDDEQRAIAAYVIGYGPKKQATIDDLQYALKDADDTVRGNAIRAMAALGVYAKLHPDSALKIQPTWFIEMLNSLIWTDRNNAAVALVHMTESRDPSALGQIRDRALPAVIEMARWHHLAHALPAYILLGRIAGLPEKDIEDAWSRGERDQLVAQLSRKLKP
jgi:hypothetical protein